MLDQKRASYIRLITLRFTIDGGPFRRLPMYSFEKSKRKSSKWNTKSRTRNGKPPNILAGLVQAMSLMKAATEELSGST